MAEFVTCEIPPFGTFTCIKSIVPYEYIYAGAIVTVLVMLGSLIYEALSTGRNVGSS